MGHSSNNKPMKTIAAPSDALVGIVKKVISGDSIVLHGFKGNPPAERELIFLNVRASKLGRRTTELKGIPYVDEPWAWEAREFLRKKIIGEKVFFSSIQINGYEYGYVWFGNNRQTAENIIEMMVREGWVSVKKESRITNDVRHLLNIEREAKIAGRGKWSNTKPLLRDLKWIHENPMQIVRQYNQKPIKAIIEYVRDGSTLRALLLPEYRYITLSISGIRCPAMLFEEKKIDPNKQKPHAHEARFFVEHRLLNRDVEIIIESVMNTTFLGSVVHPKGDIAEALLREGLAKTVEWNLHIMGEKANRLREAERFAREKHLRLWQFDPVPDDSLMCITGEVIEILLGDSIRIKISEGEYKRIYFSCIKAPRPDNCDGKKFIIEKHVSNPLYDIPFMFQCREYLRKKLIGKFVNCQLDYVLPIVDKNIERHYYTVLLDGENIALSLVENGFATCRNYKCKDELKTAHYESLVKAQKKAKEENKGLHNRDEPGLLHVLHLTLECKRIRSQFLTSWQRASQLDAIVEGLIAPSRLRLFLPKYQCLVIFVLSGIVCPRGSRPARGRFAALQEQPFGNKAVEFCQNLVLQKDVVIKVDTMDKFNTAVIGWLWLADGSNLSVTLVENGLAELHVSAERSIYYRQLGAALKVAQENKLNLWSLKENDNKSLASLQTNLNGTLIFKRNIHIKDVLITEVTKEMTFFAQPIIHAQEIDAFSMTLQNYMMEIPLSNHQYKPEMGEICLGKFSVDKKWYRAKVQKLNKDKAVVYYIDYGNTEEISYSLLYKLPECFEGIPSFATEYSLALLELPLDEDDKKETLAIFSNDLLNHHLILNIELEPKDIPPIVTLYTPVRGLDVAKMMISDGLVMVSRTADQRLQTLLLEYQEIERTAFHNHIGIWKYGAFKDDDTDDE